MALPDASATLRFWATHSRAIEVVGTSACSLRVSPCRPSQQPCPSAAERNAAHRTIVFYVIPDAEFAGDFLIDIPNPKYLNAKIDI